MVWFSPSMWLPRLEPVGLVAVLCSRRAASSLVAARLVAPSGVGREHDLVTSTSWRGGGVLGDRAPNLRLLFGSSTGP